jgi:tRNA dimethylallyltransferase
MPNGYEFLKMQDPAWAAKIQPNDAQRISRGIEVFLETGRPLSEWQARPRIPVLPEPPVKVLLLPPKEIVRERIAARMPALAAAVESEVRAIMDLPRELPVMRADGVLEMSAYFRGEISREAAIDLWRKKIEQGNMKRQYTWFRTQFQADITIAHAPTEHDLDRIISDNT